MYNQRQSSLPMDATLSSPSTRLPDYQEFQSDQNLEDAFSRLTLSPYNLPPLSSYPSLDFIGLSQDSDINSSSATKDFSRHLFAQPSSTVGQMHGSNFGWYNAGVANPGAMRSQDYLVGSDNYGPTGYSSNYDWFLQDDSRFTRQQEVHRTFPTVPLWNKDELQQNSYCMLSRNRSNFTEFNFNGSHPYWLRQSMIQQLVSDMRGSILSLAEDQFGCRLLQEMLMNGLKAEDLSLIFLELIGHVNELVMDQFGNYVFQKLVKVCTEEQRTQIIRMITRTPFQLVSICLNMHGSRAVQKLLEHATTQNQRNILILALIPGAVQLTMDLNGHHVILHCLKHFPDQDTKYLLNEVAKNCLGIATDKSGCCVLQQCLNHAKDETKDYLISAIVQHALNLAEDRYGNYVVQHLLSLKIAAVAKTILRKLQGNFVSLSCSKYGSNVVEKFIIDSEEECSTQIILELLQDTNVSMLLVDPFGNYVIRSVLMVSKGRIRNAVLRLIQLNSPMMRSNMYGKKLLAQCDKGKLRLM